MCSDWVLGTDSLGQLGCSADTRRREIFLGGTCGRSTWRQDIAIPILRWVSPQSSHLIVSLHLSLSLTPFSSTLALTRPLKTSLLTSANDISHEMYWPLVSNNFGWFQPQTYHVTRNVWDVELFIDTNHWVAVWVRGWVIILELPETVSVVRLGWVLVPFSRMKHHNWQRQ